MEPHHLTLRSHTISLCGAATNGTPFPGAQQSWRRRIKHARRRSAAVPAVSPASDARNFAPTMLWGRRVFQFDQVRRPGGTLARRWLRWSCRRRPILPAPRAAASQMDGPRRRQRRDVDANDALAGQAATNTTRRLASGDQSRALASHIEMKSALQSFTELQSFQDPAVIFRSVGKICNG